MHRFLLVSLQIAADAAFKNSQHVTSQATSPVKRDRLTECNCINAAMKQIQKRTDRAEKITADWGSTNENDRVYQYPNGLQFLYFTILLISTLPKFKKLFLTNI